jgi:hypothetical protein
MTDPAVRGILVLITFHQKSEGRLLRLSIGGLMGLDLRLLPLDYDGENWGYSHCILEVGSAQDLYEALKDTPRTPVPTDFSTFVSQERNRGEYSYGQTRTTPYGEPLQCVTVKDLTKIRNLVSRRQKRRAVWAYLAELSPDMRIALYWH